MSGPESIPAVPATAPRRRWWRHWKLVLAGVVATPAIIFALFAYTALH